MIARLKPAHIIFSILLLGIVGCAEKEDGATVDPNAPPMLEIVGGDTIDWGEVGGGELERELKLVNAGGGVLEILNVKPSCGCTTAPIDKDKLGSGEEATVKVTMDVATRVGPTQKTITITTSDSLNPTRIVYLKANVVQDLVTIPSHFLISDVQPGETGSSTINIVNTSPDPVTIQPPKLEGSTVMRVTFDMKSATKLAPGDSLMVTASATTPDPKPSSVPVTFATDSKRTKEIRVTLNVSGAPTQMNNEGAVDMTNPPIVVGE